MASVFDFGNDIMAALQPTTDAYKPTALSQPQLKQEGGTAPDGSFRVSPKGAVGPGQVMPDTARAMAAELKIPWDEQKYRSDPDYNLRLGDAYQQKLNKQFGEGSVEALAAYNAGPGNGKDGRGVLGAKQRAAAANDSANWFNYLPAETRDYVTKIRGGKAGAGGSAPIPIPDVSSIQPTADEMNQMSGPAKVQIADPFSIAPTIANQRNTVDTRLNTADSLLSTISDGIQSNNAQKEQQLAQTVAVKKDIFTESQNQVNALKEKLLPIFQKREAIAARQTEIATGAPLESMIKGIFDPNYNEVALRGADRALTNEANVLASNADSIAKLNDRMAALVDSKYQGESSLLDLKNADMNTDYQLAMTSVGLADNIAQSSIQRIGAQSAVMAAQKNAIGDAIDSMTIGQVNGALEMANKDPNGVATVNGVPIPKAVLQQKQLTYQDQAMSLETRKLALHSQQLGLADHSEDKIIGTMTKPEIESAIKNNGQFGGQQLDLGKLGQAYSQRLQTADQQSNSIIGGTLGGQFSQQLDLYNTTQKALQQRQQQMFGTIPSEQLALRGGQGIQFAAIAKGYQEAQARGVGDEYIAKNYKILQDAQEQQAKLTDTLVDRWAGGNKDVATLGKSWLTGQPVTPEVGIRGMIAMSRFGKPAGLQLGDVDGQIFNKIDAIRKQYDKQGAGTPAERLMGGKPRDDAQLIEQIKSVVGTTYNNYMMDEVIKATPQIARTITDSNGQVSSFAKVHAQDFAQAINTGDQMGYEILARDNGVSDPRVLTAALASPTSQAWQDLAKAKGWGADKFGELTQRLALVQSQSSMQLLDSSGSAVNGFKPSQAWISLMQNPKYQAKVAQYAQARASSGFGQYMMSGISGNNFSQQFNAYTASASRSLTTLDSAAATKRVQQANDMFSDPFKRADYVMAAIPNVNQADADSLMAIVTPLVKAKIANDPRSGVFSDAPEWLGGVPGGTQKIYNDALTDIIMNRKLPDPHLEAIRRRVSVQWPQMSEVIDRVGSRASGNVSVIDQ